jgi:glycosyltransferase involved in cell wall biosynthesis
VEVLFLSILPREAPSVRPRVYSYLPYLEARGIRSRVSSFLGEAAFRRFYRPGIEGLAWKCAGAAAGYLRTALLLLAPGTVDVAVIHREAVPRGNAAVLRRLRRLGAAVVYDFDDAIYLAPRDFVRDGEDSRAAMSPGKDPGEVDGLLGGADLVLAGNEVLAAHARDAGARRVVVLPTPVDAATFRPRPRPPADLPLVGWIGSPTATYCVREIAPALAAAARRNPFRLLVVGAAGRVEVEGVEVIHRDWTLAGEAEDYASLDIGIYPLPDNPWTRGKCGYKGLLYAASGVPCVASPVGINREVVRDGETGFHAATPGEWTDRLGRLLADPALRATQGAAGRRMVEAGWTVEVLAPRLEEALRSVAGAAPGARGAAA